MSNEARDRVVSEFSRIDVKDKRLLARAARIAAQIVDEPDASFPDMMANDAELEGLYRFTNNDDIGLQSMLAPHIATTQLLARQHLTLVVHDTTECHFSEHVDGMGFIGTHPGFLVHTALAVSADERRAPLGVAGMMPISRPKPQTAKKKHTATSAKESNRWRALIERVEQQAQPGASLIHVLDREADIYALLAWMQEHNRRYVIRAGSDRRVFDGDNACAGTIWSQAQCFEELTRRQIEVCDRDNTTNAWKRRVHPSRDARNAELSIRAGVLRIPRPDSRTCPKTLPKTLDVTFVYAIEDHPPEGESPIEWLLMTSERVTTAKDALKVIDYYRGRWRIEEFFKALKTGCAFEKRQSESLSALLVVLGFLAPVAWQLLALRTLAHDAPEAPASEILPETQIAALVHMKRLKPDATVRDALWAVAGFGGHLKRNGPPGWLTLGRGFEKLAVYEAGWIAASRKM